jgi:ribulose-phosphate 3-epimerase
MPHPPADWLSALDRSSLIAEFSVWSADALNLGAELDRAGRHADLWHVDACDGHFARQLLIYPDVVAAIRRRSVLPIHVHLMVGAAILDEQIEQFAQAGADLISVHAECGAEAVDAALSRIAGLGLRAGLVLTLDWPVAEARPWLNRIDMLTLVGTRIGIKGVEPAAATYARLSEARGLIDALPGPRPLLAADGGIREGTVPQLRAAGAETVVMGSLAFGAPDLGARLRWLRGL